MVVAFSDVSRLAIASHQGARRPSCPRVRRAGSGRTTRQCAVPPRSWCVRCAALALGQWNGERDAECLADAPGDVPMAGQVFGDQHVAGEEAGACSRPRSQIPRRQQIDHILTPGAW